MILITGAMGFVGRHLVQALMNENLPMRCLMTSQQAAHLPWDSTSPTSPEIVIGTLMDDEPLFRAVTGVHTIIHLESAQWWGRLRNLERVDIAGTRNLITVARAARVGRIIYLSHLGAAPSSAYTLHRIKGQVEEIIRNSGLAFTILRAGILFGEDDAFVNHIAMMFKVSPLLFLMPGQGEVALHPLYIGDLVRCLVLSLENLNAVDNTWEIGGPEYITFEDLLLTVMRVTGMFRLIFPVPPYLLRTVTRLYSLIFPRSLMTPQWLEILATNRTTKLGNLYEYFGFQPRRFEDTLVTYMPAKKYLLELLRYSFRRRPKGI